MKQKRDVVILRGVDQAAKVEWVSRNIEMPIPLPSLPMFLDKIRYFGHASAVVYKRLSKLYELSPYVEPARAFGCNVTVVDILSIPESVSRSSTLDLMEAQETIETIRNTAFPEDWDDVDRITIPESKNAWFKASPSLASGEGSDVLSEISRELRSVSPSVSRLRAMVGL